MKTRVSIIFWANKKHLAGPTQSDSPITIYCRITVASKRIEHSTGLDTAYSNWLTDGEHSRVKGKTQADKHINTQLTKLRDELTDIWADLERQGKPVTARRIIKVYKSGGSVLDMIALYEAFLAERKQLVGIDIAYRSYEVAKTRYGILKDFLRAHSLVDLRPEEFTHNMADKMLYWMLRERNYKRNYANKVLQSMTQCLRWGVRREHLDKNPLELYQFKAAATAEIKYLNAGELQTLASHSFSNASLGNARDCFVFQCWTGLAYADLRALDVRRDAEYHNDGHGNLRRVLRITRQKSTIHHGYECIIPLLPEAERILAKYDDRLNVPSNQLYNRVLKEVGQACGLAADQMTTHVGRKTAGVMMLNLGIRMETVSKFLGHSSVKMTEKVYAKILDTTVVDDFSKLFGSATTALPVAPAPVVYELPAPRPEPASTESKWLRPPPVTSHGAQKGGTVI